jgi:hypothetical protein
VEAGSWLIVRHERRPGRSENTRGPRRTLRGMSSDPTDTDVLRRLDDAAAAVREHARLAELAAGSEERLAATGRASSAARAARDERQAELHALESFGPGRVWASVRGRRDEDLAQARTGLATAEEQLTRAEADVAAARAEHQRLRTAMAELGDVHAKQEQAMVAVEDWHRRSGSTTGRELTDLALALGTTRAQLAEVREALQAARDAQGLLVEAVAMLQKARDWSSYDTFLGGGMLASAVKHDRVDSAEALLRRANDALRRLATELADVDGSSARLVPVDIDRMTRAVDVWFDNIVTDWSVRDRIVRSHERTQGVLETVRTVGRDLETRERELREREAIDAARREHLLLPR